MQNKIISYIQVVGAAVLLLFVLTLVVVSGFKGADDHYSTYRVYAEFHDVGGLRPGSQVTLSGVRVGEVAEVVLDPATYRATVAMDIRADVDSIASDSMAVIRTAGLLGDRYVDISIGGELDSMEAGDYFYETQSALHLEQYIGQIIATWR